LAIITGLLRSPVIIAQPVLNRSAELTDSKLAFYWTIIFIAWLLCVGGNTPANTQNFNW